MAIKPQPKTNPAVVYGITRLMETGLDVEQASSIANAMVGESGIMGPDSLAQAGVPEAFELAGQSGARLEQIRQQAQARAAEMDNHRSLWDMVAEGIEMGQVAQTQAQAGDIVNRPEGLSTALLRDGIFGTLRNTIDKDNPMSLREALIRGITPEPTPDETEEETTDPALEGDAKLIAEHEERRKNYKKQGEESFADQIPIETARALMRAQAKKNEEAAAKAKASGTQA